jgi:hypothetical protein
LFAQLTGGGDSLSGGADAVSALLFGDPTPSAAAVAMRAGSAESAWTTAPTSLGSGSLGVRDAPRARHTYTHSKGASSNSSGGGGGHGGTHFFQPHESLLNKAAALQPLQSPTKLRESVWPDPFFQSRARNFPAALHVSFLSAVAALERNRAYVASAFVPALYSIDSICTVPESLPSVPTHIQTRGASCQHILLNLSQWPTLQIDDPAPRWRRSAHLRSC